MITREVNDINSFVLLLVPLGVHLLAIGLLALYIRLFEAVASVRATVIRIGITK
jgi:small basic protein